MKRKFNEPDEKTTTPGKSVQPPSFEIPYADIPKLMYLLDDADHFAVSKHSDFWLELWERLQIYRYDVEHQRIDRKPVGRALDLRRDFIFMFDGNSDADIVVFSKPNVTPDQAKFLSFDLLLEESLKVSPNEATRRILKGKVAHAMRKFIRSLGEF